MSSLLILDGGSSVIPPIPPLLPFAGALVIPDVFTPDERFMPWPEGSDHYNGSDLMGDGRRIWTSALRVANSRDKRRMLDRYRQRTNYTHFVYDCAGWIYHTDYGFAEDDPAAVRSDLLLIRSYGLVPVVAACNDADDGSVVPWRSFSANADLIPQCFPMWEMNGPLGVAERQPDGSYTGRIIDCIRNTVLAAPKAQCRLHFTAGHGAPGYPNESDSWIYVRDHFGVKGLYSQDAGYDRNPNTGDPEGTGAGLADTAMRLGWKNLDNTAFEQCTYPTYNHWTGWDEAHQRTYGSELQKLAPQTVGYMDGAF